MYTRLFSLVFALLFSISAANALGILFIDGIESGRASNDNIGFFCEEKFTPETLIVITIKKTNGNFVKEVTLVPAISNQVNTYLDNGTYLINSYNTATGRSEVMFYTVK